MRRPHLLVSVDGKLNEWREAQLPSPERPRLPIPYTFGTALVSGGIDLSAIDLGAASAPKDAVDIGPFTSIYKKGELSKALAAADCALLWGRFGLSVIARQAIASPAPRRPVYFSYVWRPRGTAMTTQRLRSAVAERAGRLARAVVVMTGEQAEAAERDLIGRVPVIRLTVGVDLGFYGRASTLSDIAPTDQARLARLLRSPYLVMPGDELRVNDDALRVVERSPFGIVRIAQYGYRNGIAEFKAEVERRGLHERLVVLERISYPALRFLMQNAFAYAGLVDATWQPAGWTVACECLASGLPVVLYEGLVSRELARLGAGPDIVRSVPMRDTAAFVTALQMLSVGDAKKHRATARAFAARHLDQEQAGAAFAGRLRALLCAA